MEALRSIVNEHFKGAQPFEIVIQVTLTVIFVVIATRILTNWKETKTKVFKLVFGSLKKLPGVQGQVDKEKQSLKRQIAKGLDIGEEVVRSFPDKPAAHEEILRRLKIMQEKEEPHWKNGKLSGCVYLGEDKHTQLMNQAYSMFSVTNPLHPDVFPAVRKMEGEIIRWTADMMNGDSNVCGSLTSGGTESILMAVKAYRDFKKFEHPEMIVPVTAHAAFDKAAGYFGIKIIHIELNPNTLTVDISAVKKAITKNTIMIVGSAPEYAHGVVDPIPQLAALAKQHNIGFHTDACLGGYVLPWVQKQGLDGGKLPRFDFSVEGVTSMSVDTHKYGYAAKGTSVVLFRGAELRRAMYFVQPDWPGGMYASPTISGSRPGGLVACCWASLMAMGQEGFKLKAKEIWEAAQRIKEGIKQIPGLHLVGDSYSTVVAFGSNDMNVFKVTDAMKAKGWSLNNLQRPISVHLCVTWRTVALVDTFLSELRDSVKTIQANPNAFPDGTAALYGMSASFPDRVTIAEMGQTYLDAILDV